MKMLRPERFARRHVRGESPERVDAAAQMRVYTQN
jgi:hypothetical protein